MTMYARLWWSTLFGGTLALGCWRSGRPDQTERAIIDRDKDQLG
jgi:hypothetical protein